METRFLQRLLPALVLLLAACGGDDDAPQSPAERPSTPVEPPVGEVGPYAPSGRGACRDTYLTMTFESEPQLGTSGLIRIFAADGTEVDRIDMADVAAEREKTVNTSLFTTTMDALGTPRLGRYRIVNYDPVKIEGRTVTVKPHCGVLGYDATYYVTVDAEAVVAEGFGGVAAGEWSFTTKSAPKSKSSVSVGAAADCDFRTVQAAVDYAYECGASQAVTIEIRNGIYEEQLFLRAKNNLTLRGESRDGVVIRYDNCETYANGVGGSVTAVPALGAEIGKTGGRAVVLMENCDMIRFENLTLCNSHGSGSQAEALYNNDNNGTGRLIFVNCDILSAQDTLNLKGYGWFCDCLVAGDVDFIWGSPDTVLFEGCEIRSVNGGYVIQSRALSAGKKGFVFLGCTLTQAPAADGRPVYLGRSSGSADYRDNAAFVGCTVGPHVAAAGWYLSPLPNPASASSQNGWKEYGNTTPDGSAFVSTAANKYVLSDAEYESGYKDRQTVFKACTKGTDWLRK